MKRLGWIAVLALFTTAGILMLMLMLMLVMASEEG